MKLKTSAIYIAVLCVSLLLSLSSAFAQKRKSTSPKTRKSASAKRKSPYAKKRKSASARKPKAAPALIPIPTATPTLQGSYTLINLASATDTVNNAIEVSVKGMWFEGEARRRLQKTNLPPPQRITISYTPTEVGITTDQSGLIQTSSDGRPFRWTKDGTKYDVSTRWVNRNLERTFKGGGGRRVNTYSLSADGKTLTMHVFGTSTGMVGLTQPLKYQLDYRRN